jgi:ArsR family transcriptional regulator
MPSAKTSAITSTDQEIARAAAALAHPTRVAILRLMADRQRRLSGEITAALPLPRTTVSQHLVGLQKAGLLDVEVEGMTVSYWLHPERGTTALRRLASYCAARVQCPVCGKGDSCGCFKDGRRH